MRNKILWAAKELFKEKGYKKTTIRQIVDKSGVLIGSIYYFFKNKEEIFETIVLELFDKSDSIVNESFDIETPALKYAVMCAIELKAVEMHELICEFYYEAYSSDLILNKVVRRAAKRSEKLFKEYNKKYTFEDYYIRTLMVKGSVRSVIVSRYLDKNVDFDKIINTFLRISLQAFNVDKNEIERVISCIGKMQNNILEMVDRIGNETFSV
ncbi:TetR/AcrR family transcriptional regulator [Clostridium felsineum]|uniref:TetR/AcrR family transcriptional regulator n=1 Tax=Clostridium felsineum TaxID=36839 RepID=UPI001FA938AB|nr:TetR/AcrR family transcriptional regulator [Clostridium felsineum]